MCDREGSLRVTGQDLSRRERAIPELGCPMVLTVSRAALTEGETTQKSSMYELRRIGWRQTRCLLHDAANAVTMSEKTAHDGPSPKGRAMIVK